MPRMREVTVSIPGWLSMKLEPNEAERRAAWQLYVELATRVASQPFDRSRGSSRAALDSLYSVFSLTRQILREAGPDVAKSEDSFGPLAIRFLAEVLAPFLLRWHEPLRAYEATRLEDCSVISHEQNWEHYPEMCAGLEQLQIQTQAYTLALRRLAGVSQAA